MESNEAPCIKVIHKVKSTGVLDVDTSFSNRGGGGVFSQHE